MRMESVTDGQRAERYMRAELSDGTALARLVSQTTDFSRGSFRVAVPKGLGESQVLDFRYYIHLDGDEPTALARLIKAFVSTPNHAVLIQDTQASISDPWLSNFEHRELARAYGTEVYWAVEGAELARVSDEEMLNIVNCGSFWPFSCFFYLRNSRAGEPGPAASELNRVVESLVGVAVGAFDDRSFLIWWRDDRVPFPL